MSGPESVSREERERRIRLWIAALLSGRYQQAQGALRNGDAFCCLGVACDVYRVETGQGEWLEPVRRNGDRGSPFRTGSTRDALEDAAMPRPVAGWFLGDPDEYDPLVEIAEEGESRILPLSELNDAGTTFTEIARYLEEQILPAYTDPMAGGGLP